MNRSGDQTIPSTLWLIICRPLLGLGQWIRKGREAPDESRRLYPEEYAE